MKRGHTALYAARWHLVTPSRLTEGVEVATDVLRLASRRLDRNSEEGRRTGLSRGARMLPPGTDPRIRCAGQSLFFPTPIDQTCQQMPGARREPPARSSRALRLRARIQCSDTQRSIARTQAPCDGRWRRSRDSGFLCGSDRGRCARDGQAEFTQEPFTLGEPPAELGFPPPMVGVDAKLGGGMQRPIGIVQHFTR